MNGIIIFEDGRVVNIGGGISEPRKILAIVDELRTQLLQLDAKIIKETYGIDVANKNNENEVT